MLEVKFGNDHFECLVIIICPQGSHFKKCFFLVYILTQVHLSERIFILSKDLVLKLGIISAKKRLLKTRTE